MQRRRGSWGLWVGGLAVVLAVGAGCARKQPSPEYDEASRKWTAIVVDRPLDAALDPRADEVVALLEKVSPDALTADAAKALLKKIKDDRDAAAREKAAPTLLPEPATASTGGGGGGGGGFAPPAPDAGEPSDGGTYDVFALVGQALVDVTKRYGVCLEKGTPFESKNGRGDAWRRANVGNCAANHPELSGKLVLVVADKVFGIADESAATRIETTEYPDGGTVVETFPPDAGTPAASPDAGTPAP